MEEQEKKGKRTLRQIREASAAATAKHTKKQREKGLRRVQVWVPEKEYLACQSRGLSPQGVIYGQQISFFYYASGNGKQNYFTFDDAGLEKLGSLPRKD